MELLLAIAITLLAVGVIVLQARNNSLWHTLNTWKQSHAKAQAEAREWEGKYWDVYTASAPDSAYERDTPAPPSHDVPDIDPDEVMTDSDDPVWDIVMDCRAVGILAEYLERHPHIQAQQRHRHYGEFATFILQLPEDQRTVAGIAHAVRSLPRPVVD